MLKKLAFVGILVLIIAAAYGAAATLGVQGGSIQAGVDTTLYCDPDGVFVTGWGLETDPVSTVYYVKIGGIDGACVGNEIFVRVENGTGGTLYYSGAVAVVSPEMKFSFSPTLDPASIEHLRVWIEGPTGVTP